MLVGARLHARVEDKCHERQPEQSRGPLHLSVYGASPEKTDQYGQRHEEYVLHTHLRSRIAPGRLRSRLAVAALNVTVDGEYSTHGFQLAQEPRELVDAGG